MNKRSHINFKAKCSNHRAVTFGELDEGEIFRLARGTRLLIKSYVAGSPCGIYLHSGNSQGCIPFSKEVVRVQVEMCVVDDPVVTWE